MIAALALAVFAAPAPTTAGAGALPSMASMASMPSPVPPMPSPAAPGTRGAPTLHLGWTCHTRADCESGLAELGIGYSVDLTARVELGGRLVATRPHGIRDGRDAATLGGGGDLVMRWHLLAERPPVDPYVELVGGLVAHVDRWPPGGSHYVFRRSFGLGLAWHLGPAITLRAGVRQMHLSNGQGLGAHNPAFDGLGGDVGLSLGGRDGSHPLPALLAPATDPAPARAVVQAQAALTEFDGELGAEARVEARAPLGGGAWAQIRAEHGRLFAVDYVGGELDLVGQGARGLVGLTGGVQSFGGLVRRRVALQGEWYADALATVAAQVAYATHDLGDATTLRVQWLLHPFDWIALGVGYEHAWDDRPAHLDDVQPAVSVEVAPPWIGEHGFTLAAEREIGDLRVFSLRYTAGAPADLRARHRAAGMQPLR